MNPSLVKFMVDLQNSEKVEVKEKNSNYLENNKIGFFNVLKPAKVTVPVKKD